MATENDTAADDGMDIQTVYLPPPPGVMPSREVLEKHIERQRGELMQAQAIVETVVEAMRPADWPAGKPGFPLALGAVVAMLERVTEQLDSAVLFDLPGAEQESRS